MEPHDVKKRLVNIQKEIEHSFPKRFKFRIKKVGQSIFSAAHGTTRCGFELVIKPTSSTSRVFIDFSDSPGKSLAKDAQSEIACLDKYLKGLKL